MKKSSILISAIVLLSGIQAIAQNSFSPGLLKGVNANLADTEKIKADDSLYSIVATDNRNTWMLGVKGGFNRSNVYNATTAINANPVMGWVAGVFITMPINKLFGFQPELLYAQKGFKALGTVDHMDYDFTRKTIYLDVPLLMQVKVNRSISVFAGPLFSFLLHSSDKFTYGAISAEQKNVITNGTIHKNILGAETGIDIYIHKVVGSIRAGWDLQKLSGGDVSNSRRYENSWIQATIGFMF